MFNHSINIVRHLDLWVNSANGDRVYGVGPAITNSDIAIYCIHGTADKPTAFDAMGKYLKEKVGMRSLFIQSVAFSQRGTGRSIQSFAEELRVKIRHKNVILIGHSRGGLIAAYYAEFLAPIGVTVHEVITIASPFQVHIKLYRC